MIVTPEGLKVFPQDVEQTLDQIPGVRDSAVIGQDQVHAVLLLAPNADANDIVRQANARLEDHQKIRSFSIWTGDQLPRTPGTRKLRRAEIASAIASGRSRADQASTDELTAILQKYAPGRAITPETTLDDLGLSSLDRVQLMMDLEQKFERGFDETAFSAAHRVADLSRPAPTTAPVESPIRFPEYARRWFARAVRRIALPFWLLPLARIFAHVRAVGRDNLRDLRGPVMFASNHQSHLDVPVILMALPARWRYRLATAMSKEFFDAHFFPERDTFRERFRFSLEYCLSTFFFNAFPLPQRESGARQSIRYMGEMTEQGWSILIFPEGDRTQHGEIHPFRPGVAMIATELRLPIVPLRIEGLERVLQRDWRWPRMGRVTVHIGRPIEPHGESFAELAAKVEATVRKL